MSVVATTSCQVLAIATGTWLTIAACVVVLAFPLATATAMELSSMSAVCVEETGARARRAARIRMRATSIHPQFLKTVHVHTWTCAVYVVETQARARDARIQRLATTMNGRSLTMGPAKTFQFKMPLQSTFQQPCRQLKQLRRRHILGWKCCLPQHSISIFWGKEALTLQT